MSAATLETISVPELEEMLAAPSAVVEAIPVPTDEHPYEHHYQAEYPDKDKLADAIEDLQGGETITSFKDVDATQSLLTDIATGQSDQLLAIGGPCADRLRIHKRPFLQKLGGLAVAKLKIADRITKEQELVEEEGFTYFTRYLNMAKPRSKAREQLQSGITVNSWYGDITNGQGENDRTADPQRLQLVRDQGVAVMQSVRRQTGKHVPVANEMLSLPYIMGMIRKHPVTGKLYNLASDMCWLGNRTNDPAGIHAHIASMLANPIGIKLGPDTPVEKVTALIDKLNPRTNENPDRMPGRLTFVFRMGDKEDDIRTALQAIKEHDPSSHILFDPHGSTEKVNGDTKVRIVSNMIKHIQLLARLCHEEEMPMRGILSESSHEAERLECVDEPGELPRHQADVDPLINRRQHRRMLAATRPLAGRKALQLAMQDTAPMGIAAAA